MYASLDVYGNFMTLKDTIYSKTEGSKKGGHALVAVAYGVDAGTKYWVLQNSWGTSWGVNGYGKMLRGTDLAGIETGAYYMRAWVSTAKKAPPCYDAKNTGLNGGSGPIPCTDAKTGGFGDLCANAAWKKVVTSNCPVTCASCKGGATGPAPMPAPPPTTTTTTKKAATTTPAPAPAPTNCSDSSTYTDPYFGDDCKNWANYLCTGFTWTKELQEQCPVACKMCDPLAHCQDDPSYTDPTFGDDCAGWKGFVCSGFTFSDALKKACPRACKACKAK